MTGPGGRTAQVLRAWRPLPRLHPIRLVRPCLALAGLLLLAACGPGTKTPGWDFSPAETPPAPREYVNPPAPAGDHYVWELGHWEKKGQDYEWVPGHYVQQPEGGSGSAAGRWIYTGNNQWIWIPGHWRKD